MTATWCAHVLFRDRAPPQRDAISLLATWWGLWHGERHSLLIVECTITLGRWVPSRASAPHAVVVCTIGFSLYAVHAQAFSGSATLDASAWCA